MTASFAGLKRRKTNFDQLEKQFTTTKKSSNDDRFYYPEREDGNGYAVIRFLPTGDDSPPFVKYYTHRFKGLNGWYWHNCRTTIDEDCPCCDVNRDVVEQFGSWDATPDREKTIVRNRKRQMYYTSNIVVVKDPRNPENEGKVFLFRYGAKIMEKIKEVIKGEFGNDPIDPFNPWSGADFELKIKKVKKQTNYDSSAFKAPSPLYDDDEAIEALVPQLHDLGEFVAEEFFAPYDVQKKALDRVLGISDRERNERPIKDEVAQEQSAGKEESASEAPVAEATDNLADTDELASLFDEDEDIAF
mgnify:CR=1 FL=1